MPKQLNQSWLIDFMQDALICGHRFRTFNMMDDYNREALAIEIDLNLPAQRVVRVQARLRRGCLEMLRMHNRSEFIFLALA